MLKDQSAIRATARLRRARLALVFALVSGAALILAACGGGGGGGGSALPKLKVSGVPVADDDFLLGISELRKYPSQLATGDEVPLQDSQIPSYAHSQIGASIAHGWTHLSNERFRGQPVKGQEVVVAVADSGFDVNHPDLRDNFIWRRGQNPMRDQPVGRNFLEGNADDIRPRTDRGLASISHGTHVAGIIAARDNNDLGVAGVAPLAKILPMRVLNDGEPDRYRYTKDISPDDASLDSDRRRLLEMARFARTHGAFVVNNSWGYNWRPVVTEVVLPGGDKRYLLKPRYIGDYDSFTRKLIGQQLAEELTIPLVEPRGELIFVFAAGNDGWNSETGEIPLFSQKFEGDDIDKYLNFDERDAPEYIRSTSSYLAKVLPESRNYPSPISAAFLGNPALREGWLAVVATDSNNKITRFSNGCGVAKHYCLAAPGVNIVSTVDARDTSFANKWNRRYGLASGTSMAAPMVSGALAVLRSYHPALTRERAIKIILCTATDLDKSEGRPSKSVDDCSRKSLLFPHDNGWEPSEVYGHGLVNLARALQPIGQQNAAGGTGRGVAASADTRIAFSSAFGNAAPSARHHFGGFDSYGRVYRYRAPLQDRVMPGPRLSGVLALNGAAGPVRMAGGDGTTALLRRSTTPESVIGDGTAVTLIGTRHRTGLAIASSRTSAALSPAALIPQGGEGQAGTPPTPVWQGLAPRARDVVSGETEWRLAPDLAPDFRAGAYFSRALADAATRRGESYGLTDFGVTARLGKQTGGVRVRLGQLTEQGRFLGSKPEGGYALARPTRSGYLHLSAERRLSERLSVGANVMQLRANVDFRHDSFVRDTTLQARSAGAHLALRDAARAGDRLMLHYGEPLAVTGGAIRQSSVMGYTAAGNYRAEESVLDLGVRKRHRMAQVMYRTPLGDGISGFAAAAHHRNWSHRGGLGNTLVMLGLSVRR